MLTPCMHQRVSVQPPHLTSSVWVEYEGVVFRKVVVVVVPAKGLPLPCEGDTVIQEETGFKQADANDEERIILLLLLCQ